MAEVVLEQVRSTADDGAAVIDGVDLRVPDGQVLALLGASGSGKTTLLRLVAGLAPLGGGTVRIDGRDMAGVPPERRDLAMVVQDEALLPHLTVRGNVGFGLRMQRLRKREIARRVTAETRVLHIEDLLERRPDALSGGERQAAAVARATVRPVALYLLDEPFAHVDAAERGRLRRELTQVMRWRRATALLVTNDPVEAMAVGDRLAVLHGGRIAQVGAPPEVYARPASTVVAQLVGVQPMALLPGVVELGRRTSWVRIGSQRAGVSPPAAGVRARLEGAAVLLGVRPEQLEPVEEGPGALSGTVVAVQHLGSHALAEVALDGLPEPRLTARVPAPPAVGGRLHLRPDPDAVVLFDPADGAALPR